MIPKFNINLKILVQENVKKHCSTLVYPLLVDVTGVWIQNLGNPTAVRIARKKWIHRD
jgi:hypothetical protein